MEMGLFWPHSRTKPIGKHLLGLGWEKKKIRVTKWGFLRLIRALYLCFEAKPWIESRSTVFLGKKSALFSKGSMCSYQDRLYTHQKMKLSRFSTIFILLFGFVITALHAYLPTASFHLITEEEYLEEIYISILQINKVWHNERPGT